MTKVLFQDWGLVDYQRAWDRQEALFHETVRIKTANRRAQDQAPSPEDAVRTPTPDYLIFCEHPHVYTLGKSGKAEHLLLDEKALKNADASFYKINRGGDITYHGPGQIVGYPILDLDHFFTDIHKYLRLLEESVILTLKEYGVEAGRMEGLTGVWLDAGRPDRARKICALGVRCSRWVTMHGFAFNVNASLDYFKHIVPCGIPDKAVASLQGELGRKVDIAETKIILKEKIAELFGMEFTEAESRKPKVSTSYPPAAIS